MYRMNRKEYQGLLKIAAEQVPFGVYAELRCDRCESMTKLKEMIRAYKQQGYRVHANGKEKS